MSCRKGGSDMERLGRQRGLAVLGSFAFIALFLFAVHSFFYPLNTWQSLGCILILASTLSPTYESRSPWLIFILVLLGLIIIFATAS